MEARELVIVGGGPAGLTAGLYAARARLDAVLIERLSPGGQMLTTDMVENWPGDLEAVSGFDLSDRMRKHAQHFGLEIVNNEVSAIAIDGEHKIINTPKGDIRCKALILCPGASPRKLGVPGEAELTGKGVSYCGTCDGPFYREQEVACVGGGDTAAEEALFLTKFAKKVFLIHRRDQLRATGILAERVMQNDKIEVLWSQAPLAFQGEKGVESVRIRRLKDNSEYDLAVQGAFVFVGTVPNTQFLDGLVEMDGQGFIITDKKQETSLPGVFAAGDCCAKILRQIVTAAGDGATAAFAAQRYLEE
ncbi:thioredoxin reductase [Desulfocarbo indianensis]|nr:thioredoxin reductase [Desulfocarbo indianensis]